MDGYKNQFEIGKYYRVNRSRNMFVKVVKRNDDTGYITVQYLNNKTGELYSQKYARKIKTYGWVTDGSAYESICIERGGWGSFNTASDAKVRIIFKGVALE